MPRRARSPRLLSEIARIDPVRLACFPGREELAPSYWAANPDLKLGQGVIRRLRLFGLELLNVRRTATGPMPSVERGKLLFVAFTGNQIASLAPAVRALQQRGLPTQTIEIRNRAARLPFLKRALPRAAPFLPLLALRYAQSSGYARQSFHWAADAYLSAYGVYATLRDWLARGRPALVVIANDHTLWPRALVAAARSLAIPTAYVQHAAVAPGFPALETDLAFLEGEESLAVYRAAGPTTTAAYLVGIAKLDVLAERRSGARSGVAICVNAFDPAERVAEVVKLVRERLPGTKCVLRPHPRTNATRLEALRGISDKYGCSWSDATVEPVASVLGSAERVIAGESAILLEGAVAGSDPIMYDFSGQNLDRYGFVKRGLAVQCRTPAELGMVLEQPVRTREQLAAPARHFSATAGTALAGRTGELMADVLANRALGREKAFRWVAVGGGSPEAFRPAPDPTERA